MKLRIFGASIALLAVAPVIPAHAADFGGNCCADLEERIAELEATAARKGNRKVSLTVSGHVQQAVMYWDDGEETNTYVVENDSGRTRFRFTGSAKISSDLEAGYRLEIGIRTARSDRVDQFNDDPGGDKIDIRYSAWYLKSKTFGEVHVGQTEVAAQSVTQSMLTQNKDIANHSDVEDQAAGFQLRVAGQPALSGIEWRRLVKDDFQQPGEGNRGNVVWYKSPKFAGFQFQAGWGEDDYWDVGLRYSGEIGSFKVKAGVAYGANSDSGGDTILPCLVSDQQGVNGITQDADCHQFGGSLAIMHAPTGLFVQGGAGVFEDELIDARFGTAAADEESTYWSLQAGIEQKWTSLGKTTLFGGYFKHDGGANDRTIAAGDAITNAAAFGASRFWDTEVEMYEVGIVQGIDNAAMRMYLFWRHYEADATIRDNITGNLADIDFEDLDTITGGAIIKF